MPPLNTPLAAAWRTVIRLPQQLLMLLVRAYRLLLKPWLGNACRFEPSCSAYSLQALQSHGAFKGSLLTTGRLLRCQPWCNGGHDPVPERFLAPATGLFSRLGLLCNHHSSHGRSDDRSDDRGNDIRKTRNLP